MKLLGAVLTPVVKASNRWPSVGAAYYRVCQLLHIHPGVERWDVKTLADADAPLIDWRPVPYTIANLISIPNTQPLQRQAPVETTVYSLSATDNVILTAYKIEVDGDYHLALSDGVHTMIAEIPDPDFLTPKTPATQAAAIKQARTDFDAWAKANKKPVSDRYTYCQRALSLTGVGFFDFNHGQKGVAPNAIELHPVLSIQFS